MKSKIILIFLVVILYCPSVHSQITNDSIEFNGLVEEVELFHAGNYNPVTILRASNELMDLSKQEILDTTLFVYHNSEGYYFGYGLFLLLQLTFDLPDSLEYPEIRFGVTDMDNPIRSKVKNRFPLLLVQGFPVLLPIRYQGTGLPTNLKDHIEFYRKHGIVRSKKYELECNCSFEELQSSMATAWKEAYSGDMSQYHEEWYINQLKMIAKD